MSARRQTRAQCQRSPGLAVASAPPAGHKHDSDAFHAGHPSRVGDGPAGEPQREPRAMGGGYEYLLVLAAGAALEIRRRGRLYGGAAVVQVENVGGEMVVTNPRDTARSAMTARPVW